MPVRVYRPEPGWVPPTPSPATDDGLRAGLVWYHGGGFVGGDLDMPEADLVARGIATRTGSTVVSVFYRLCADGVTHHPVPHDDCWAAYTWARDHAADLGIDVRRVAVGGASAGACLAGTVGVHGRDADRQSGRGIAPWQVLLAYPVAHASWWPAPSEELATCLAKVPPVLNLGGGEEDNPLNRLYLGGPSVDVDPWAYPGESSDLSGFPTTYIENSENDSLRASGEQLGRQLAAAGADVEVVTAAGVPHGHLNAVGSPLTAQTLDRFAARLAREA